MEDNPIAIYILTEYPESLMFVPAVTKSGSPDSQVLIQVVYHGGEAGDGKVPISANVHLSNRYMYNHLDYNFDDENCPTEESVKASKKSVQPIDIRSTGEYFFDHGQGKFIDTKGRVLDGKSLVSELVGIHTGNAMRFRGAILRARLGWRQALAGLFGKLAGFALWFMRRILGRTFERTREYALFDSGFRKGDLKKTSLDKLKILGWEASKSAVLLYGFVGTGIGIGDAYCWFTWRAIDGITSSNMSALGFTIVFLWFVDGPLVDGFRWLINGLIACERKCRFEPKAITKTLGIFH